MNLAVLSFVERILEPHSISKISHSLEWGGGGMQAIA